jgi:preprotein translocase subunit YajC
MLGGLKRGDRVLTGGGIYGRIARLEGDDELIVEIAPEVRVRVARGTVSEVIVKGEPVNPPAKASAKNQSKTGGKTGAKSQSKGSAPTVERK